jgi:hypothetical protein
MVYKYVSREESLSFYYSLRPLILGMRSCLVYGSMFSSSLGLCSHELVPSIFYWWSQTKMSLNIAKYPLG